MGVWDDAEHFERKCWRCHLEYVWHLEPHVAEDVGACTKFLADGLEYLEEQYENSCSKTK